MCKSTYFRKVSDKFFLLLFQSFQFLPMDIHELKEMIKKKYLKKFIHTIPCQRVNNYQIYGGKSVQEPVSFDPLLSPLRSQHL